MLKLYVFFSKNITNFKLKYFYFHQFQTNYYFSIIYVYKSIHFLNFFNFFFLIFLCPFFIVFSIFLQVLFLHQYTLFFPMVLQYRLSPKIY